MYRCICNYKSTSRMLMMQHMSTCHTVRAKHGHSSHPITMTDTLFDEICDIEAVDFAEEIETVSISLPSSESGGCFDGGGASDSFDND